MARAKKRFNRLFQTITNIKIFNEKGLISRAMSFIVRHIKRVPRSFWFILLLFAFDRLILTFIGYATWRFFGSITSASINGVWEFSHDPWWLIHSDPLLSVWGHWDSGWYLRIAHEGYFGVDRFGLVFFPLFPFMTKLAGSLFGDYYVSGLLVNTAAIVVTLAYLYRFCKERWGEAAAVRAAKYLIIFPTSFYLSSFLSEPLFIMLCVLAFYYGYKDKWVIVGPIAGLVAVSRPIGALIIMPLLLLYVQNHWQDSHRRKIRDLLNLSWMPLAAGALLLMQKQLTNQWFVLPRLEELGWRRHFLSPFELIRLGASTFTNHLLLLSGLLPIVLVLTTYRRLGWPLVTWGIVAMIPALLTGVAALPRYATALFPIYIALSLLASRDKVDQMLTTIFALCQGLLMLLWSVNAPFLQ